jgi:tetratricopeptide (TPR) repeat protein
VNAADISDDAGESSSKDTRVDLSPPPDDAKEHPQSSEILMNAEAASGNGDVSEVHLWNPHKAAKDVEVGDFYFKRKNYRAAEDRYREALEYKNNDAVATFRLAVCLEKLDEPEDARKEYESYLKILPHGPQADEANKALGRLNPTAAKSTK